MVWDIEHIVSKDKKVQFMFEPRNLCVACKNCNGAKGSKEVLVNPNRIRFPSSSQNYKIIHPHFDTYHEHINAIVPGDFYRPLRKKVNLPLLLVVYYDFMELFKESSQSKTSMILLWL